MILTVIHTEQIQFYNLQVEEISEIIEMKVSGGNIRIAPKERNCSNLATCTALWVKPLRNWEFKDWPKMMTLAPIFLKLIYFRPKYLDACSSSVSLSIYIWVQVENRQIQQ